MKKLCESSLGKIEVIDSKITYSVATNREEYYRENRDNVLSGIEGMASSLIGGTIGLVGGVVEGTWSFINKNGFVNGYKDFNNQYINPTLQNIRNSAPDEDAYDVGYAVGTVLPIASGLIGIIDKAGKISSIGNIASVTGGVAVGAFTIDASSAMGLIKSFVQASVGIGVGGTSDNNNPSATELKFESDTKSAQKLNNEMEKRGWTKDTVKDTVNNPHTTRKSTNKANGNSATVYYKENGAYVVVDDVTKEVVQVSDNINPSAWTPDSGIIDPYKP